MTSDTHFWSYLAYVFLEWEMFEAKFAEKIETNSLYSITFFFKSRRLRDNVKKTLYSRAR